MMKNGIDVTQFKNKGLLHVLELGDPFREDAGFMLGVGKIVDRIMKLNPDRIVSWRWIRDIGNRDQNLANKEVERVVDAAIEGDILDPAYTGLKGFAGLLVCTYTFNHLTTQINWDWMVNHPSHHDSTILASKEGTIALNR